MVYGPKQSSSRAHALDPHVEDKCSMTTQGQDHLEKMQNFSKNPHEKVNYQNIERKRWILELIISPWETLCQDKRVNIFLDNESAHNHTFIMVKSQL